MCRSEDNLLKEWYSS